jgi:hypothetical protein
LCGYDSKNLLSLAAQSSRLPGIANAFAFQSRGALESSFNRNFLLLLLPGSLSCGQFMRSFFFGGTSLACPIAAPRFVELRAE